MKISAVVVTYNRKELLLECLHSLLSQTRLPDEIIILDNASTDGTRECLVSEKITENPIVKYVCLASNMGGAGGFYYGSKQAYDDGADWIWMMDDDCIPTETALENLVNAAQYVEAGYLCSAVFGKDGECGSKPSVYSEKDWYTHLDKGIVTVSRATFVSFMVSRDAVTKCGLPYKQFFIWGDDTEYCARITKYYLPGFMVGSSRVVHKTPIKKYGKWGATNLPVIGRLHYSVRNELVNAKEYMPVKGRLKVRFKYAHLTVSLLFGKRKKRFRKIGQIFRGFWEYRIGTYDRKALKNRFTNHLDIEQPGNL